MEKEQVSRIWPEWEIVEPALGRGAYASVYKAVRRDAGVESCAAIKVITVPADKSEIKSLQSEGLDEAAVKIYFQGIVTNFVNEIQLMESLKGIQNIVSVEDYKVVEKPDEIGWNIYIRMELLTPFTSYLCRHKIDEAEAIRLGCDICTALEICSKRKIIHRDIKPENLFINDFGYFKLGDFGVARTVSNMTNSLSQTGTFAYMAPEIAKQAEYDERVDIYSLGIVLYRLLNHNRLPFLETEEQLLNANLRENAIRRRINGECIQPPCDATPEMADVILRACAFNPEDRFASAQDMKKALMQVSTGDYVICEKTQRESNETSGTSEVHSDVNTHTDSIKETDGLPEVTHRKRSTKKTVGLFVVAIIILGAIAGLIHTHHFQAEKTEFLTALENADYDTAATVLRDNTRIGKNKETLQKIGEAIDRIKDEYLNSEIEYENARAELNAIESFQIAELKEDVTAANEYLNMLKESHSHFEMAESFYTAKNYKEAIPHYQAVSEEDLNYKTAKEKLAECVKQFQTQELKKVDELIDSKKFSEAISVLDNALKVLPGDSVLTSKREAVKEAHADYTRSTALKDAEALADKEDYAGAMKVAQELISSGDNHSDLTVAYEKYRKAYIANQMDKINRKKGQKKYKDAAKLAQQGLDILPDCQEFKDVLAKIELLKPTPLDSLELFSGEIEWNDGVPEDPFGNQYQSAANFVVCDYDGIWESNTHCEYYVDKKYDLLTMTIAPHIDMSPNPVHGGGIIKVYADDSLIYTSPKIERKTKPFECNIDISGATYIRINFLQYDDACNWSTIIISDAMLWPEEK